jgi:hypothetical protein
MKNGALPMKQTFVTARLWIVRVALFSWLAVSLSLGSAQANTVSYTLDNVFLDAANQMTGTFEWTYTDNDFEKGTGLFSELFIPLTSHTLDDLTITFDIGKSIEFTLTENSDSDGVDISLVFINPLTPTQSTLLNLVPGESKWALGGTGTNHVFISGGISPVTVPVPAAAWLFGSGLLGLVGIARRNKA